MSRPCFALSVMLCCMYGPLLIIGKTHAQDPAVSPSHDPGECIVCPLAHGPLEPCGGYSDYDYNHYWYDDDSPPASEPTPPAVRELEVAQSPTDGATEQARESDYDDYYADYLYGDGTTNADAEESKLEEASDPAGWIDSESEAAPAPDVPPSDESFESYDEYGWYSDADGDYFESYDDYEPIDPAEPEAPLAGEATTAEVANDYEAYEHEWFSYGAESTVDAPQVDPETDEAYEALSESDSEAYSDAIFDAPAADETWGDEEAWYREEYGYDADETWGDEEAWYREEYGNDGVFDEAIEQSCPEIETAEQLETGYDEAYDEAMAADLEAAEPSNTANLPTNPSAESLEMDDYESFYEGYDDLYDFESPPADSVEAAEASEPETSEVTVGPGVEEQLEQAVGAQPAWLTELVDRMLAPIWTTAEGIALDASITDRESRSAIYMDECAQEWDCESDYWARPQPLEQPSVVLTAADTLDGMAAVLQNAAQLLRAVAGGSRAETAQAWSGGTPR